MSASSSTSTLNNLSCSSTHLTLLSYLQPNDSFLPLSEIFDEKNTLFQMNTNGSGIWLKPTITEAYLLKKREEVNESKEVFENLKFLFKEIFPSLQLEMCKDKQYVGALANEYKDYQKEVTLLVKEDNQVLDRLEAIMYQKERAKLLRASSRNNSSENKTRNLLLLKAKSESSLLQRKEVKKLESRKSLPSLPLTIKIESNKHSIAGPSKKMVNLLNQGQTKQSSVSETTQKNHPESVKVTLCKKRKDGKALVSPKQFPKRDYLKTQTKHRIPLKATSVHPAPYFYKKLSAIHGTQNAILKKYQDLKHESPFSPLWIHPLFYLCFLPFAILFFLTFFHL